MTTETQTVPLRPPSYFGAVPLRPPSYFGADPPFDHNQEYPDSASDSDDLDDLNISNDEL